ncbi:acyltransferase [Nioella sp.]|uniref:acyltransferase n=1 Tax=Nioella sp. TaxID=1912091 RepID=UPI003B51CE21
MEKKGEKFIELSLPSQEYPNLKVGEDKRIKINVTESAIQLIKERKSQLRLILPDTRKRPFIAIGRFQGVISLNFRSPKAAFIIEDCKNFNLRAMMYEASYIHIGRQCSSNDCSTNVSGASIVTGNDCMLSHNITLQPSDQHDIFDLSTGRLINYKRSIVLGNHVWLGKNSYIGSGVKVGDGAIVGANAIVTKDVPDNSVVAGNPARVVREGVSWSREFTVIPGIEN